MTYRNFTIKLELKWQDCWLGFFWKRTSKCSFDNSGKLWFKQDIWICLLPCLPIHICYFWRVAFYD